jgi:2-dehydropantoate 2-reductase
MNIERWPRIAVLGAGAVGCWFGSRLAKAGAPVTLIGRARHMDAIARSGLTIESATGREVVPLRTSTDASAARDAEVVLVCVKSSDTDAAGRELARILDRHTAIVSLQNGVDNADRLGQALPNPVFAAVVYVGTSMEGDGVVRHAGRGDLVLGAHKATAARPDARSRLEAIAAAFERAGIPCPVSEDIVAALWTKLAINCAFNAISALGQSRYGRMAREAAVRDLMEAIVRETVAVARADGVALNEASLLDATWKVAEAMAGQFSSTAQDLLRGKRTEIDALNGFVAQRGAKLGVATPINATLHALVRLREEGEELAG